MILTDMDNIFMIMNHSLVTVDRAAINFDHFWGSYQTAKLCQVASATSWDGLLTRCIANQNPANMCCCFPLYGSLL